MAGPYYVDIDSPGAWSTKTGLDTTTNALLGLSGLQYLIDTVTVGNGPIYVKGSTGGDVAKLKSLSCDNLSGTFTRGESVTWDGGSSSGVVSELTSNYPSVIEVISGTLANDDNLVGATSGATADVNGAPTQKGSGLDFDTNAGANNVAPGYIKVIGCNDDANYTVNGNRAIIDGNSAAANVIQCTGTADLYWLENIEFKRAGTGNYDGIVGGGTCAGWVFINCCANNCGRYGFNLNDFGQALLVRCVSYSNTSHGFNGGTSSGHNFINCCSRDNATIGFRGASMNLIGSIVHGNTDDGLNFSNTGVNLILNSVIDSNSDDGILVASHSNPYATVYLIGSRITNHSAGGSIGLNCNSEICITGWNYFENNADANIQNDTLHHFIPLEGGSSTSNLEDLSNTTSGGYVNPTNHDFSTNYVDSGNPDLRRTAITIPWS